MKRGRPSKYTPELAERILRRMYSGESLRSICRDPDIPDRTTVDLWRVKNEEFYRQYAHARRAQVEARIEDSWEMLQDTPMCEVPDPDGGVSKRVDGAAVQLMRARWDAARWEASKLLRGIKPDAVLDYGEKIQQEVSGPNGGPVEAAITVSFVKSGEKT